METQLTKTAFEPGCFPRQRSENNMCWFRNQSYFFIADWFCRQSVPPNSMSRRFSARPSSDHSTRHCEGPIQRQAQRGTTYTLRRAS